MQLFCPTCQAAFAGKTHCNRCGGRLLSPQESFIASGPAKEAVPEFTRPTLGGRMLVGSLVAAGVLVGLMMTVAAALPADTEPAGWWAAAGWPVAVALRMIAVAAGALVAGAGRRPGAASGLGVGIVIAAATLGLDAIDAELTVSYLIAAGLVVVVGAPAGLVGVMVWPPHVPLPEATAAPPPGSKVALLAAEDKVRRASRPNAWVRIAVGAAIASAGVLAADDFRLWLLRGSGGAFQIGGTARAGSVGLQLATFAVALGGLVAGAASGAGPRHGALAGVVAAAGLLIAAAGRQDRPLPPVDGFFVLLGQEPAPLLSRHGFAQVLPAMLVFMTVCGYLGGQLFPPLAHKSLRNRRLLEQS